MKPTYKDIWELTEYFVKQIEELEKFDSQRGRYDHDECIPFGYAESVESLKQHAIDVRDFYFEGAPDGEGGEDLVGSPVEWTSEKEGS
tara:strand:- start:401 stop:664 length:264 start_codon:yes stop_codon:yes gene_type:complete